MHRCAPTLTNTFFWWTLCCNTYCFRTVAGSFFTLWVCVRFISHLSACTPYCFDRSLRPRQIKYSSISKATCSSNSWSLHGTVTMCISPTRKHFNSVQIFRNHVIHSCQSAILKRTRILGVRLAKECDKYCFGHWIISSSTKTCDVRLAPIQLIADVFRMQSISLQYYSTATLGQSFGTHFCFFCQFRNPPIPGCRMRQQARKRGIFFLLAPLTKIKIS